MKNLVKHAILGTALAASLLQFGCKKDDDPKPSRPANQNPTEVFTTIRLTFTPTAGGTAQTFVWRQLNNVTTVDTIRLATNGSYTVTSDFWDESKNPTDTITKEIRNEAAEHQVFYVNNPSDLITWPIANFDQDANNRPLGLRVTGVTTRSTAGTPGTLVVTLKHDHNKSLTTGGVYTDAAGGETDVEVTFPVKLQ